MAATRTVPSTRWREAARSARACSKPWSRVRQASEKPRPSSLGWRGRRGEGGGSHALVSQALPVLKNLLHRGACGCEVNTGDGAGILIQMPHAFLSRETERAGFRLPQPGHYGAGLVFLPPDPAPAAACRPILARTIRAAGE